MDKKSLDLLLMIGSTGKLRAEKFLNKNLQKFEERESIKVNVRLVSWNRAYESIISSFKSSNAPDVFQVGTTWMRSIAYLDYLQPINDYQEQRKLLVSWIEESCFFQGERYAVPWLIDAMVMVARNDILKSLAIDNADLESWDSFYQVYLRLLEERKKDKSFPKAMAFSIRPDTDTLQRYLAWYYASNNSFPELTKDISLSSQEFIKVFKCLHKLITNSDILVGDVDKHPYQLNDDFYVQGSYVFYLGNWYGIILQLLNEYDYTNNNYEYIPLKIPSLSSSIGTHGGGSTLAISSQSRYPEKARKLLDFLLTEEFSEGWMNNTANMPVYETPFWQKRYENKKIHTLHNLAVHSNAFPYHPSWSSIENLLAEGFSRAMWKLFEKDLNVEKDIRLLLEEMEGVIQNILALSWESN
ncbi:MAG: extracellular solute-binding protein [bacterium]